MHQSVASIDQVGNGFNRNVATIRKVNALQGRLITSALSKSANANIRNVLTFNETNTAQFGKLGNFLNCLILNLAATCNIYILNSSASLNQNSNSRVSNVVAVAKMDIM